MKTFRVHLHVLDPAEAAEVLDLVTDIEGVVAALVDETKATLEVVVSKDASALLVREQLLGAAGGAALA